MFFVGFDQVLIRTSVQALHRVFLRVITREDHDWTFYPGFQHSAEFKAVPFLAKVIIKYEEVWQWAGFADLQDGVEVGFQRATVSLLFQILEKDAREDEIIVNNEN